MKKLLAICLALIVILSLCACGVVKDDETPKDGVTKYEKIVYAGNSPTQTLDIYVPQEGEGPFPVIFAIHGGGFEFGSANMCKEMIGFTKYGYAVVGVNYRMSGEAIFPAAVSDCKAAVRFIRANASEYNLDSSKMAIWGASAGANLAVMVGILGNTDILDGDVTDNIDFSASVDAVIDWFGPLDFFHMDSDFALLNVTEDDRQGPLGSLTGRDDSPESKYIGQNVMIEEEYTQRSNPLTYLNNDKVKIDELPMFFIQHGNKDVNVPYLQSQRLFDELKSLIGEQKVFFEIIDEARHEDAKFSEEGNLLKIKSFLDGVIK